MNKLLHLVLLSIEEHVLLLYPNLYLYMLLRKRKDLPGDMHSLLPYFDQESRFKMAIEIKLKPNVWIAQGRWPFP